MGIFQSYYGCLRITDGVDHVKDKFDKVVAYHGKYHVIIRSNFRNGHGCQGLAETKYMRGRKVLEWEKLGAFHRGYETFRGENISAPVTMRYLKGSIRALHGISERWDQELFGQPGKCRTRYSRGRVMWQDFRYRNGRLAYRLNAGDRFCMIRHPNGKPAAVIGCAGQGFSTRSGLDTRSDTHTCQWGEMYFSATEDGTSGFRNGRDVRKHDYSRDGNCSFNFWDRRGRLYSQGEYANHQKVGEWVVAGKHVYFVNGVTVSKQLWDTPPEKLKAKTILRVKNAQMRMALLARMGYERFVKQAKGKLVDHDKKRENRLLEFPQVRVSDGNGRENGSALRILVVTCTSTKQLYYLNVPDFVWDGGKRTKLNTCEAARQWTFGVDDPRKRIEFAQEA